MKLLADEGIKFLTGVNVGSQIKGSQLLKDNDAVLLCTGSTRPRDLPVPGELAFLSKKQQLKSSTGFMTLALSKKISYNLELSNLFCDIEV